MKSTATPSMVPPVFELYPPLRMQSKVVALMFALSAMNYFDRIVMSIAGPGIMKDFGISETQMGSVYSAFLLSYTVLMAQSGWLPQRFAGRIVLNISGLGAALFTGLTSICGPTGLGAYLAVVITSHCSAPRP